MKVVQRCLQRWEGRTALGAIGGLSVSFPILFGNVHPWFAFNLWWQRGNWRIIPAEVQRIGTSVTRVESSSLVTLKLIHKKNSAWRMKARRFRRETGTRQFHCPVDLKTAFD